MLCAIIFSFGKDEVIFAYALRYQTSLYIDSIFYMNGVLIP